MQFAEQAKVCNKDPEQNHSLGNDCQLGRSKHVLDADSIDYIKNKLESFYDIQYNKRVGIFKLSSVTFYGIQYIPGANNYLVVHNDKNHEPEFGRIKDNWFIDGQGIFFGAANN